MWTKETSIHHPKVKAIKDLLIKNNIVSANAFDIPVSFDPKSSATHFPITFIIDISSSLKQERDNLNTAIRNFLNTILESQTTLSSSVDFSIVTFADRVIVKRPFGYITSSDQDNHAEKCTIKANELSGLTNMASGLFVAWYLGEARKQMYLNLGGKSSNGIPYMSYKQPLYVLITDFGCNEKTEFDGRPLINIMTELLNAKTDKNSRKAGLIKAKFGKVYAPYDNALNGINCDSTVNFGASLNDLFQKLAATVHVIVDNPEYDNDLEEDDLPIPLGENTFSSDIEKELLSLFAE